MTNLGSPAPLIGVEITPEAPRHSIATGLRRGLQRQCPNCGKGRLFRGYLKVQEVCSACGNANGRYPADDGPAYCTILLIGHLVVAPLLALSFLWSLPPGWIAALGLPIVGGATLAALPFVKGGWIGVLWGSKASAGDEHLGRVAG